MDWTQFLNRTDSWKLFTVDMFPAVEIEDLVWNQDVTYTNLWKTNLAPLGIGNNWSSSFALWKRRKKITIQTDNLDDNLIDFPLYVRINADTDIGMACRSDGFDLRFTAADGVTELPYEREFFVVAPTTELLLNGGFANTDHWTPFNGTIASISGGPEGENCLEITRVSEVNQGTVQVVSGLIVGASYIFSAYVKSGTSGDGAFLINTYGGGSYPQVGGTSSGAWTKCSLPFIATSTSESFYLQKYNSTPGTMLFGIASVVGNGAVGIFWVKTDVEMAGTYIWCYYGNAGATDGANPDAVWDTDFKAVYHMKDATTSTILDSTANNNDGAKTGENEPIEADGKIGKGQDFDGTDDVVNIAHTSSQMMVGEVSVSFWLYNRQDYSGKWPGLVTKTSLYGTLGDGYGVRINPTVSLRAWVAGAGGNMTLIDPVTNDVWIRYVMTYKSGVGGQLYRNGVLVNSQASIGDISTPVVTLTIGHADSPNALLDEIRISSIARPAAWIAYEYANMNPADGGLTWGAEEVSKLLPEGVVIRITQDGEEYLEAYSLTECQATTKSFYYDFTNQILYLQTTGTDNPGKQTTPPAYDYVVLAFVGRYISNAQWEDNSVVFPRITESLKDGGFEQWTTPTTLSNWVEAGAGSSSVNRESTSPYSGAFCVRLDVDSSNSYVDVTQNIRLVPGAHCKLVVWYKHSGGATSAIQLCDSGGNVYLTSAGAWGAPGAAIILPNTPTWTTYELEFTAHSSYTDYVIYLKRNSATSASCYFDKASIAIEREENPYEPLISSQGMPALHQGVSLFHEGAMVMEFGTLQFVNDGWWFDQVQNYLWHLKDIKIRYGAKGSTWDEMTEVFTGRMRYPKVTDVLASIDVVDNKVYTYKSIPEDHYDVATYPNLESGPEGWAIPIIYGEFSEIVPTCIDISSYKYKIACHAIEAIPQVWKNGVLLTISTDYTVDLANGEFTLLADPGEAFVTCSVKGRKCDILDGTYSENVADILYDLLVTYGGLDPQYIDMKSFLDLKNSRSQKHHLYLDTDQQELDIIRLLTQSALFHFIPLLNGNLGAFRYVAGVDSLTPVVYDEDISGFSIEMDTTTVFKIIKINYGLVPSQKHWESTTLDSDEIEWKHGVEDTLELTSSLRLAADAGELADYYKGVLQNPAKKVKGTFPFQLFAYRPGQKIIINKTRVLGNGTIYNILTNEPYRLLDLNKQMQTGKVEILAWEDLQSSGGGFCEVCYHCEVCVTTEAGSCSVCYACEESYGSVCGSCQDCYYCQLCDSGQCSTCESCDSCELCVACEATYGSVCPLCQLCNTGQCTVCMRCDSCQRCYACQDV